MATATQSSEKAFWGFPVILGLGMGLALTCIVTAAQLSTPPELIAIASGSIFTLRSLGGSVALATYTAIFNSISSKHLQADVVAAVVPLGFDLNNLPALLQSLESHNATLIMDVPTVTPEILTASIQGYRQAYLAAFRSCWIAAAAFAGVTALGMNAKFIFEALSC